MATGRAREKRRPLSGVSEAKEETVLGGVDGGLPTVSASKRSGGVKAKNTGFGHQGSSGRAGVWLDEEGMGTR